VFEVNTAKGKPERYKALFGNNMYEVIKANGVLFGKLTKVDWKNKYSFSVKLDKLEGDKGGSVYVELYQGETKICESWLRLSS